MKTEVIEELHRVEKRNGDVLSVRIMKLENFPFVVLEKSREFEDVERGRRVERRIGLTVNDLELVIKDKDRILAKMREVLDAAPKRENHRPMNQGSAKW